MSRPERSGYGTCRSPERSSKAYPGTLVSRCALALVALFALTAHAQDVNVHIEPKSPAPAKTVDTKEPAGPDALKNHGKPGVAVDVNLVLVNVTVTDDWN